LADNSIEGCGELQEASMSELNDVVGPMAQADSGETRSQQRLYE